MDAITSVWSRGSSQMLMPRSDCHLRGDCGKSFGVMRLGTGAVCGERAFAVSRLEHLDGLIDRLASLEQG